MLPLWARQYIGIPFREHGRDHGGADCWGLLRLVLFEQFGVELPDYGDRYASASDRATIAAVIRGEMGPWREVPVIAARAGDGVLLRVEGQPMHVGVVVAAPKFLHILRGINACIEDWTGPHWSRRLLGVYRHEALA